MRALNAYEEVKQKITEDIVQGRFLIGKALPSEKVLSQEFHVSIGTLRKAVDELVSEGVVVRKQGIGTFIVEHNLKRLLYYFFHVVRHDANKKFHPNVVLESFESGFASAEEASKLEIKDGSPVWRIVNLLHLDGRCVMVDQITLDKKRFKKLSKEEFIRREGSIYQLYQAEHGQVVIRTSERLRASHASKRISDFIGVKPETAVLTIRRIALNIKNEPIEWRVSTLNTKQHEYFSELVV